MFSPTFRRLLLTALCAGIVLAAGCAREKAMETPKSPRPLLVGGDPKSGPKSAKPGKTSPFSKIKPPQIMVTQRGVTIRWDAKDGTQMTATAKSGDYNQVTQVGTLLDFSGKLYENGKLTASVSAPMATIDAAKRTVIATGGVTLRSLERQTVVKSSWIKWYANQHRIVGDGGVHMESKNEPNTMKMDAAAFQADTALKTLKVMDSAKGLNL